MIFLAKLAFLHLLILSNIHKHLPKTTQKHFSSLPNPIPQYTSVTLDFTAFQGYFFICNFIFKSSFLPKKTKFTNSHLFFSFKISLSISQNLIQLIPHTPLTNSCIYYLLAYIQISFYQLQITPITPLFIEVLTEEPCYHLSNTTFLKSTNIKYNIFQSSILLLSCSYLVQAGTRRSVMYLSAQLHYYHLLPLSSKVFSITFPKATKYIYLLSNLKFTFPKSYLHKTALFYFIFNIQKFLLSYYNIIFM